jgi:tetratricopeptide (TPR) repeat protein
LHALRFGDAIAELEQALRCEPLSGDETMELLALLAEQEFGVGDLEAARAHFDEVTARSEPRSWQSRRAHRGLLELHRYAGELANAEHHATLLWSVFSHESEYAEAMARRVIGFCRAGEPLLRVVVVARRPDGSNPENTMIAPLQELDEAGYFVEVDDFLGLPGREHGWELEWRRNRPELAACTRVLHAADVKRSDGRTGGIDEVRWAAAIDPLSPRPRNELGRLLREAGDVGGAIDAWLRADALAPGWPYARAAADGALAELREGRVASIFSAPFESGRDPYPISAEQRGAASRALRTALEQATSDAQRTGILSDLAMFADDRETKRAACERATALGGDLMAVARAKIMLLELGQW